MSIQVLFVRGENGRGEVESIPDILKAAAVCVSVIQPLRYSRHCPGIFLATEEAYDAGQVVDG